MNRSITIRRRTGRTQRSSDVEEGARILKRDPPAANEVVRH